MITKHRPEIIIDCFSTATALAYQNIYQGYQEMLKSLQTAPNVEELTHRIYHLLTTACIPPLIRHIQILNEVMRRTGRSRRETGTGGVGLNIPFTHGEEQPSRLLLSKTAVAGAHTLLLFLLNRTPGGPIVKELKPAALIGWKGIGRGRVKKGGSFVPLYDCAPEEGYRLTPGKLFCAKEKEIGKQIKEKELEGITVNHGRPVALLLPMDRFFPYIRDRLFNP